MGTRCLTIVTEDDGTEILTMYRQMDGYPDGHGEELKKAFGHFEMVNGISNFNAPIANGAGCLAAQIVAHFKSEVGSFYLYPSGTRDCGEEYIYVLKPDGKTIHMAVYDGPMTAFGIPSTEGATNKIYGGPLAEFDSDNLD